MSKLKSIKYIVCELYCNQDKITIQLLILIYNTIQQYMCLCILLPYATESVLYGVLLVGGQWPNTSQLAIYQINMFSPSIIILQSFLFWILPSPSSQYVYPATKQSINSFENSSTTVPPIEESFFHFFFAFSLPKEKLNNYY